MFRIFHYKTHIECTNNYKFLSVSVCYVPYAYSHKEEKDEFGCNGSNAYDKSECNYNDNAYESIMVR